MLRTLTLALTAAAMPLGAAAKDWPTHDFRVELTPGEPGTVSNWLEDLVFARGAEADAFAPHIARMETYLNEAAVKMDDMGFDAPPMQYDDQGYIVALFDYDDALPPARAGYSQGQCRMRINSSRAIRNGHFDERLFEHLGHELFHCVQNAYPLFSENWTLGDWIVEGTAQAIGEEMAFRLRGKEGSRNQPVSRWGGRSYARPLADRVKKGKGVDDDLGYLTASLWRYLAEEKAARSAGSRASAKERPGDYSYLHPFFQRNVRKAGVAAETAWLDKNLEKEFKIGLDRIYPAAVSTLIDYAPGRMNLTRTPASEARKRWMEILLGACHKAQLSDPSPTAEVTLSLPPVTAACVSVGFSLSEVVDVIFQAESSNLENLESLVLAQAGGARVAQPIIASGPNGGYLAHWQFRVPTDETQYFAVSNINEDPAKTPQQTVTLKLTMSGWQSSMTTPKPEKPAPGKTAGKSNARSRNAAAPSPSPTPGARAEDPIALAARKDIETGVQAMSAHSTIGMRVFKDADPQSCEEPFVYQVCGPTLTIELSLAPGSYGAAPLSAMGRGGITGQMMGMTAGMEAAGYDQYMSGVMDNFTAIARTEGAMVTLITPLIDYGFTGTLDKAMIEVSDGDGGWYRSRGPADTDPSSQRKYRLNGKVTITEYSASALRGRFSGVMTDENRLPDPAPGNASLPVVDEISGAFTVASPWLGEEDLQIHTGGVKQAVIDDLIDSNPAMAPMMEAARSYMETVDIPAASGGGSAGGVDPDLSGNGGAAPADPALREAYRNFLLGQGMPEFMVDDALKDFDAMPPEERRMLAETLGL